MTSIAASLWDSIFTPGPTPVLVRAMNISFFALLALLIPLGYATRNIHVFILFLLTICLWISMQWYTIQFKPYIRFLVELEKAKKDQNQRKIGKKEE